MKTFEVKYRRLSHPSWVCTEYVAEANEAEALKEARKRLAFAHGKHGFKILYVAVC